MLNFRKAVRSSSTSVKKEVKPNSEFDCASGLSHFDRSEHLKYRRHYILATGSRFL